MAAIATWMEDNGAANGPGGSIRLVSDRGDFKGIADSTTTLSADNKVTHIEAGKNSYSKFRYVKFSGSFTSISNVRFAHTGGTLGAGMTIKGKITNNYSPPSTYSLDGDDITPVINIENGAPVRLGVNGPESAVDSSLHSPGFTEYCVTQLQTSTNSPIGNIPDITFAIQWDEV